MDDSIIRHIVLKQTIIPTIHAQETSQVGNKGLGAVRSKVRLHLELVMKFIKYGNQVLQLCRRMREVLSIHLAVYMVVG